MPLRPGRAARRGVIGAPVARTAAVVGTAAVVAHGVNRRHDRRKTEGTTDRTEGKTVETGDVDDAPNRPVDDHMTRRIASSTDTGCELEAGLG